MTYTYDPQDRSRLMASPKKLRSGDWGALVQGKCDTGQKITVKTRAGKTMYKEVSHVIWTNNEVSIVEVSFDMDHEAKRYVSNVSNRFSSYRPSKRSTKIHTSTPCDCGNWSGPGSECLGGGA